MAFLNALPNRLALALAGGVFYGLLTHSLLTFLDLPTEFTLFASGVVFLFYLSSRLLLLFSGFDTPYYSKGGKASSRRSYKNTSFYRTAQWVGKFYHYHDMVLFVFLVAISITFLISLMVDWSGSKAIGNTIQTLWNSMVSPFRK